MFFIVYYQVVIKKIMMIMKTAHIRRSVSLFNLLFSITIYVFFGGLKKSFLLIRKPTINYFHVFNSLAVVAFFQFNTDCLAPH